MKMIFLHIFLQSFLISQDYLSLYVFFENGEQARRVMEPVEDQVKNTTQLFC